MTKKTLQIKTLLSLCTFSVLLVFGLIGKQAEATPLASACKTCQIAAAAFPIKLSPQIFRLGADVAKALNKQTPETPLIPGLKELIEQANQLQDTPFVQYDMDPRNFEFTTPFYSKAEGVKFLPGFSYGQGYPANPLRNGVLLSPLSL